MLRTVFKVVTPDMRSLGLRKNPTILTYSVGRWVVSPKEQADRADAGGIWAACELSGALALVRYMRKNYRIACRVFEAQVDARRVKRENTYRLQAPRIRLVREIVADA